MTPTSMLALLTLLSHSLAWPEAEGRELHYATVPGYFLQDDASTDPDGFDYAAWNFGLVNRTYPTDDWFDPARSKTQWQRFAYWLDHLNNGCRRQERVRYKLLVFGRHGQGWHNTAESFYGTPAWNCYWAELDGNGTSVWADALLTGQGLAEAARANGYFASRFSHQGMPYFDSYYVSPLSRCVQTANATFASLDLPADRPFRPVIKELLREGISVHTCDRRSTRSRIRRFAPASFAFEPAFAEADELWQGGGPDGRGETEAHALARAKALLDDVFAHDDGMTISLTSHSGQIASLLTALRHRPFSLGTGQIIPVLVRASAAVEEREEPRASGTAPGFTREVTCTAPPVTSIAGTGCVCSTGTLATATMSMMQI